MTDPSEPVVLTTVPSEAEAAMIVAKLDAHGIDAQIAGALTSAFRAEVPGRVSVMVRSSDLEAAQQAMQADDRIGEDVPEA